MKIKIIKRGSRFEADPVELPGNPPVGRGDTITEALGDFLRHYQVELGVQIEVDASAMEAEQQRRSNELADR